MLMLKSAKGNDLRKLSLFIQFSDIEPSFSYLTWSLHSFFVNLLETARLSETSGAETLHPVQTQSLAEVFLFLKMQATSSAFRGY